MSTPSFRIYLTANALAWATTVCWMPDVWPFSPLIWLFTTVFSLPSLLLLYGFFRLAARSSASLLQHWLRLAAVVFCCCALPVVLFAAWIGGGLMLITVAAVVGGIGSVVLQHEAVQRYFQQVIVNQQVYEIN